MEPRMFTLTTLLVVAGLTLLGGGVGGGVIVHRIHQSAEAGAAAQVELVEAVGTAATGAVHEAIAPAATEAQARLAFATTPAVNIAVEAAVQDPTPTTVALAGYLGCLAASQAQAQGAAAYGCAARGLALDAAVGAMVVNEDSDAATPPR